ncbi:MAG: hypothetical protein K940chlam9_01147 [Chlamydiae bacterium]|nr:hypothetical protein [Chlamydiota bacterium]
MRQAVVTSSCCSLLFLISASLIAFWIVPVREKDIRSYQKILEESAPKGEMEYLSEQKRENVLKKIWLEKESPLLIRIKSECSYLRFAKNGHQDALVETFEKMEATLEEEGSSSYFTCERGKHDYKKQIFEGEEVSLEHPMGRISAHKALITFSQTKNSFYPTEIVLTGHVTLFRSLSEPKEIRQYALADQLILHPKTEEVELIGTSQRVLFYDELEDVQISAPTIYASRNQETGKERIEGRGDVRLLFGKEERERFQKHFQVKKR